MCSFGTADEKRESQWIKVEVDSGAGKTAWPQNVTRGKTIPGENDLVFHTATGEFVMSNEQVYVNGCDEWGKRFRIRGVQAPVCKPLLSVAFFCSHDGEVEGLCHGDDFCAVRNGWR